MIGEYSLKIGPAGRVAIEFEEYKCEYLARTGILRDLRSVLGSKGAILRVNNIEHEMSWDTTPHAVVSIDIRKCPDNYSFINFDPCGFIGRYFIKELPTLPHDNRQWQIKLDGHIAGPTKIAELKSVLGFGGQLQDITIEENPLSMYSKTVYLRFVQSRLSELVVRKEEKEKHRQEIIDKLERRKEFMNLNPTKSWAQSWLDTYKYVAEHAIDDRKPMINYWRQPDLAEGEHSMEAFRFLTECLPRAMTPNEAREALGMPKFEELSDKFIVKNGEYIDKVNKEDNDMYKPSDEYCMKQLGIKEVCDLRIKKVIFNKPATIILWEDGTKTVVKCQPGDKYDKEKGFAFALMKKIYGSGFNDVIKYWCN